jgi:hypothetical protein
VFHISSPIGSGVGAEFGLCFINPGLLIFKDDWETIYFHYTIVKMNIQYGCSIVIYLSLETLKTWLAIIGTELTRDLFWLRIDIME